MDAFAVIQRLGSGRLLEELHAALVATAQEVVATGKPGKVTLTLAVSNRSQGDPLVMVDETISRASPKRDPKGAVFYALDGGLHREDPRQIPMVFRTVDSDGVIRDSRDEGDERAI